MQIDEKFHTFTGSSLIIGWLVCILICCVVCIILMIILGGKEQVLVFDIMQRVDPDERVRVIDEDTNRIIYAGRLNEADEAVLMMIVDRIAPVDDKLYLHTR